MFFSINMIIFSINMSLFSINIYLNGVNRTVVLTRAHVVHHDPVVLLFVAQVDPHYHALLRAYKISV